MDVPGGQPKLIDGGDVDMSIVTLQKPLVLDQFWHFQPKPHNEQSQGLHYVDGVDLIALSTVLV